MFHPIFLLIMYKICSKCSNKYMPTTKVNLNRSICRTCQKIYLNEYRRKRRLNGGNPLLPQHIKKSVDEIAATHAIADRKKHLLMKEDVLLHYTNNNIVACNICGYSNIKALCLDHIDGDGHIHRKNIFGQKKHGNIYYWLKKHQYPQYIKLQVLCFNCNQIKKYDNKEYGTGKKIKRL